MPNLCDALNPVPAGMIQPAGFFIIQLGDNFCGNSSRGAKILLCPVHQGLSVSASAAFLIDRHQFDFPRIPLYRGAKNGIAPLPARNDPDPAGGRIKTIPEPAFVQCGLKRPETAVQPETGAMTGRRRPIPPFFRSGKKLPRPSGRSFSGQPAGPAASQKRFCGHNILPPKFEAIRKGRNRHPAEQKYNRPPQSAPPMQRKALRPYLRPPRSMLRPKPGKNRNPTAAPDKSSPLLRQV